VNIKMRCWVVLLRNEMAVRLRPISQYTDEQIAMALEIAQQRLGEKAGYEALRTWLVENEREAA